MNAAPEPLQRLAEAVRRRRLELGLTQAEASTAARVSDTTWSKVENAQRVSEAKFVQMAAALGWRSDAADRIADGEDPDPLVLSPPRELIASPDVRIARLETAVAEIESKVGRIPELTEETVRLHKETVRLHEQIRQLIDGLGEHSKVLDSTLE